MKKLIIFVLSFVLTASLCSCNNNSNLSPDMSSAGKNVIKIVDDYMDSKIDYSTASKKLDGAKDSIDRIYDNTERDEYNLPVYKQDFDVQLSVTSISIALLSESTGHGICDELLEKRNDLAKIVGVKQRKE